MTSPEGVVLALFIAQEMGGLPEAIEGLQVVRTHGSNVPDLPPRLPSELRTQTVDELTVISTGIADLSQCLEVPLAPPPTTCQVIVEVEDLGGFVDLAFKIGGVTLYGEELQAPYALPGTLGGSSETGLHAFHQESGIIAVRAQVIRGGELRIGSRIAWAEEL